MDNKISTYSTLWCLVDIDDKEHSLKTFATLFLDAMNDWKLTRRENIYAFITDLKEYFGNPLTVNKISEKKYDGTNTWELEAGSSIAELISISTNLDKQNDFDKIVEKFINYYNMEFNNVDFIAELQYLTTEQGGRKTPVFATDYRPQIKFDFDDMQTLGQQTFINKVIVYPGEKVEAKIKILSPDYFSNCLTEGMKFEFREGYKVIGTGEIKYIINDRLEKASR
ncbi:MAG: hypothetical protein IT220_09210 [Flavobacteriaceae bacterium]|nr:hypothetical protein [Flavobacteriaceae bacterium]